MWMSLRDPIGRKVFSNRTSSCLRASRAGLHAETAENLRFKHFTPPTRLSPHIYIHVHLVSATIRRWGRRPTQIAQRHGLGSQVRKHVGPSVPDNADQPHRHDYQAACIQAPHRPLLAPAAGGKKCTHRHLRSASTKGGRRPSLSGHHMNSPAPSTQQDRCAPASRQGQANKKLIDTKRCTLMTRAPPPTS